VSARKVHLRGPRPGQPPCGAGLSRWSSTQISTTSNPELVTCRRCLQILAAREQRLAEQRGEANGVT
jgi:hypothetical protein